MMTEEKEKIVFISHSTKDKDYVFAFVELLEALGFQEDEIVCSSIPPYCIPLNNKVYEWLVDKFQNCELHVMYMLSHNYYGSVASLNEMGAAWAMKQNWSAILLPGFAFSEIAGCIDPSQIGIKLDDSDIATLKYRLGELKEILTKEFGLRSMSSTIWERKRDEFISRIQSLKIDYTDISLKECEGYCIGEFEHNGCIVVFDRIKNKISANIDFTKTKAEICSVVIFTGDMDMSYQYKADKKLVFDLKTTDTIDCIDVECRLKNRNVHMTQLVSSDWENYSIPLSEFGGGISEWKSLKEVKFLLRRKDTPGGSIEIRNVMIK